MIAVYPEDGERETVAEFFELFKTPWEFFREGSPAEVLICSHAVVPENDARLVLILGSKVTPFDVERGLRTRSSGQVMMVSRQGGKIPLYGNALLFGNATNAGLKDELSGEAVMVEFNSNGKTIVRLGYDLFLEIGHLLMHGQPETNAAIPAVEMHIALLRNWIVRASIPLIEIPPVPDGGRFIACLTHDADHLGIRNHKFDHTMFGFLHRATVGSVLDYCRSRKTGRELALNLLAAFKLPLVHLGLARDFWLSFDRYLEMERGLNSTFFVIPRKGETGLDARGNRPARRAASYDVTRLAEPLKKMQSAGDEIGVHGIDAWRDSQAGRQERETISRLTGRNEAGVRMHWLFFTEQSPAVLEAAGFSYDSTVGYNQTIGYRAGTTQVFKPRTVRQLLELPLHLMDTALFYPNHLNLSPARIEEVVRPLIDNCVHFGGVLTVNWHDRSVVPERLWDTAYLRLLEWMRSSGACFLTAAHTVAWFRKRRETVFEQDDGGIKIRVPSDNDVRVPGLCVRRYELKPGRGDYSDMRLPDGDQVPVLPAFDLETH